MSQGARLLEFIRRSRRRQLLVALLEHGALGLVGAVVVGLPVQLLFDRPNMQVAMIALGVGGLLVGLLAGLLLARRHPTALEIERRAPECRNAVFTASELLAAPLGGDPYVRELVTSHASAKLDRLDPSRLFPAGRAVAVSAIAVVLWAAAVGFTATRDPDARLTFGAAPPADEVGTIEVVVTPPAYTRRPVERSTNPVRVEAIAGSRVAITVRGTDVTVETLEGALRADSSGAFALTAAADGFIAIRAGASARRLIGLTVTQDQVPRVRVTAPGKDMFLPEAKRRVPVEIEARDDLAITALKLRYTKVSGSGERFTFIEGETPVTIERASDREWRARGTLDLASLQLEQGDMIVYRGAAADGRPGAALTESDAFIIEITSPGSLAAEGFSLDDEMDKYALSQQMVILKTERLLARAAQLSADSLAYYSQSIAAEQRAVRAEFVFMMGGEVAEEIIAAGGDIDETHEAENEDEILAGRLVNRGRAALINAIRQMSRASQMLNEGNARDALPVEKAALNNLQEAFSRTRYLLRALTQRERLDLSRRLTGVLTLATGDARPADVSIASAEATALRGALAAVATLWGSGAVTESATTNIAQSVLAVDPSDTTLQQVAAQLTRAGRESGDEMRRALDAATTGLTAALRARLPGQQAVPEPPGLRRLRGSLTDALRGRGVP